MTVEKTKETTPTGTIALKANVGEIKAVVHPKTGEKFDVPTISNDTKEIEAAVVKHPVGDSYIF